MGDFQYEGDTELLEKLQNNFAGKIVRKDLTKRIKEGANVPVYPSCQPHRYFHLKSSHYLLTGKTSYTSFP